MRTKLQFAAALMLLAASAAMAKPRLKALIVDGQNNHKWQETTPVMKKALEATGLFTVDVATAPPEHGDMSRFQPNFAAYQVVIGNYTGDAWGPGTRQAFAEYVRGGGGYVVVHAADNAFGDWKEYNEIIGLGGWGNRTEAHGAYLRFRDGQVVREQKPGPSGHHGRAHAYQVTSRDPEHPILRGLPALWLHVRDELYDSLRGPGTNLKLLATSYSDPATGGTGENEPSLFTISYGKGRVFHTTLGHDAAAMECVGFLTTFVRGAEWAATGAVTQKAPADFPGAKETRTRVGLDATPVPEGASPVDKCNVVWDSPSENAHGSMPLGNGDIGLNVWMEKNGDLLFYIGKSDAWSDTARLLKIGRVRVKFSPNPFVTGRDFRQTLKLRQGAIEIRSGEARLLVWADANQPVVRVEAEGPRKFDARATVEIWRERERELTKDEANSAREPGKIIEQPDRVVEDGARRAIWYHRNTASIWPFTLRSQGLESFAGQARDPLLNRTFGGLLEKSPGRRRKHVISVHVLTGQTASADEWVKALEASAAQVNAAGLEPSWLAHRRWWNEFWTRSWVRASGTPEAEQVTLGYTLQRFMNACTGRGAYPIKFNGATLTVDALPGTQGWIKEAYDADFRSWGGPYWFQNTRLIYWPMVASGDAELVRPFFRMYRDALPLAEARTRSYFSHEGAFFPETMYFWGAYATTDYGTERTGKPASWVTNPYIRHYWQGGIELVAMMLDYFAYTQDRVFLRDTLLPLADGVLGFYDRHYARDGAGKIRFEPAQSLETWWVSTNPMPEVAGLKFVLDELLASPDELIAEKQRAGWRKLRGELPALPMRQVAAGRILSPAETFANDRRNSENPELYAIFPYRIFGAGKPELEMARRSFAARQQKYADCWHQDDAQLAYLGLARQARELVTQRFAKHDPGSRFPGFWGPNNDYTPDFDHGGVGQTTLQAMLAQPDGDKILLLPAWPREWDVEFKLRAPKNTTIEGVVRQGKLEELRVTPASRAKDVVKLEPR